MAFSLTIRYVNDGTSGMHRSCGWKRGLLVAGLMFAMAACAPQTRVDPPGQTPQDEVAAEESERADAREILDNLPMLTLPEPEAKDEAERRKVALLLPLSGDRRSLGQAMLQAAQLALFDVADEDFELTVRDTRGTPEGAESAALSAVDAGASLFLGPIFSASVQAVTPIAEENEIPVLAFSNNHRVAQRGVYVMGLMPGAQVERVVGYASTQGHERFGALVPDNAFGEVVAEAMEVAADRFDVELTRLAVFPANAPDISDSVRRLGNYDERQARLRQRKAELQGRDDAQSRMELNELEQRETLGGPPFDAVMVPVGGQRLQVIAPMLPFFDIDPRDVRILGTAEWNDPALGRESTLVGGWFAAPSPEGWSEFAERYRTLYGEPPPRLASLAYDATALAALLPRQATRDGRGNPDPYAEARLTQANGFAGIDGIFRLNPDGTVDRRYAVMEMEADNLRIIDPAPSDFRPAVN